MTVRVVVPVSGGKDSQACLELATKHYERSEILGLFCDTKFEHPLTYQHIEDMRAMYGVQIDVVNNGSVEAQVLKHGRFPGGGARFCSEELKIWPAKWHYKALAEKQGGFEVWYGMRLEESSARRRKYAARINDELYPPHEILAKYPKYLAKMGVMFRLAILDWTEEEVFASLNLKHNPLYDLVDETGEPLYDRVGCYPCLASGDKPKENAFHKGGDFGREQYRKVIWLGQQIGKSIWTSKGGKARNEGGGPCALLCNT
jgi:3'-phosphoadenosine 5'-phosphosulfate sulfotransferase (PAPS reductase)/FAD synthetase